MEKQFSELNLNTNSQENSRDDMDVEQKICTKASRNKSNNKSLTHSKKINHQKLCARKLSCKYWIEEMFRLRRSPSNFW